MGSTIGVLYNKFNADSIIPSADANLTVNFIRVITKNNEAFNLFMVYQILLYFYERNVQLWALQVCLFTQMQFY